MLRSERGQNVIETALVSVFVLIPLFAGMVDLGRAFFSYIQLTNAAREGARAASRLSCYNDNPAQRAVYAQWIRDFAIIEVDPAWLVVAGPLTIDIDSDPLPAAGCVDTGEPIEVRVSFLYETILPGTGDFTMSSSSTMSRVAPALAGP